MSILSQIPSTELGTRFTHYGWFCGVVPVYLGNLEGEAPLVAERNGIPEWVLSLAQRCSACSSRSQQSWHRSGYPGSAGGDGPDHASAWW